MPKLIILRMNADTILARKTAGNTGHVSFDELPDGLRNQVIDIFALDQYEEMREIRATDNNEVVTVALNDRISHSLDALNLIFDVLSADGLSADMISAFSTVVSALAERYQREIQKESSDKRKMNLYYAYLAQLETLFNQHVNPSISEDFIAGVSRKNWFGQLLYQADQYMMSTRERPTQVTITGCHYVNGKPTSYIVQSESPLLSLSDEMAEEILNTQMGADDKKADWYKAMPDMEKKFFDFMLRDAVTIDGVKRLFPSISSKLRTIPGVPNFSLHQTLILDANGNLKEKTGEHYRSSMVASREMYKLKLPKEERRKLQRDITVGNINEIIQKYVNNLVSNPAFREGILTDGNIDPAKLQAQLKDVPIFVQTLISPVKLGLIKKEPDYSLFIAKREAIDHVKQNGVDLVIDGKKVNINLSNIISTNHPLNSARHITGHGMMLELDAKSNRENIERIIELGRDSDEEIIRAAADQLDELSKTRVRGLDNNQRELHIAALEEFIISRQGWLSCGSCVSGKDRKALELIYVDAMTDYTAKYGKLPRLDDNPKERGNFVDIVAVLFVSRHQQFNANLNAAGAAGIKTPDRYLPRDICEMIKRKGKNRNIIQQSDKLADTNDYRKGIKKGYKVNQRDRLPLPKELAPDVSNLCVLIDGMVRMLNNVINAVKSKLSPASKLGMFSVDGSANDLPDEGPGPPTPTRSRRSTSD